jgi:hypothetical protein
MENIFKDFTKDQLWENLESDFFRCREPEFIDRLEELMIKNESIRIANVTTVIGYIFRTMSDTLM